MARVHLQLEDNQKSLLKKSQVFQEFDVYFKVDQRFKLLKKGATFLAANREGLNKLSYLILERLDSNVSTADRKVLKTLQKQLEGFEADVKKYGGV